jgi:uncharacterized protein (DUF2141 family)
MVRKIALIPVLAAVLAVMVPALAPATTGAPVGIEIVGVRSASGNIEIAVYNSAESFLEDGQSVATVTLRAADGVTNGELLGLPAGHYAIAVFHDENANNEFDTNFIGLPEKGYGFSNEATVFLGPPDYEDAAVEIAPEGGKLTVQLTY